MKRRTAITLAVVLALWFLDRSCQYQRRSEHALLRESGRQVDSAAAVTDRRVAELLAREVERESTLARSQRQADYYRREVGRLTSLVRVVIPDSIPVLRGQVAIRDSVIIAQDSAFANSERQLTIWRALAIERGVLLTQAIAQRDEYRAQRDAWRKRQGVKRCGPAIGPGIGLHGGATIFVGMVCRI